MASKEKPIKLYLSREMTNHLIEMLTIYQETNVEHEYVENENTMAKNVRSFFFTKENSVF